MILGGFTRKIQKMKHLKYLTNLKEKNEVFLSKSFTEDAGKSESFDREMSDNFVV